VSTLLSLLSPWIPRRDVVCSGERERGGAGKEVASAGRPLQRTSEANASRRKGDGDGRAVGAGGEIEASDEG
jgi:hypothetical protein